jgi:hypothetical protein
MADPLVNKLADKVLEYLATFPDGHQTDPVHALSQLASDENDLHVSHDFRTYVFKGVTLTHDETNYHLPVAIHERAGLHGLSLEHVDRTAEAELPHVLPFVVRHVAV